MLLIIIRKRRNMILQMKSSTLAALMSPDYRRAVPVQTGSPSDTRGGSVLDNNATETARNDRTALKHYIKD